MQARARGAGYRTVVANRAFVRYAELLVTATKPEIEMDLRRVQYLYNEVVQLEQLGESAWSGTPPSSIIVKTFGEQTSYCSEKPSTSNSDSGVNVSRLYNGTSWSRSCCSMSIQGV